jgi:mercuric reductase
MAKQFPFIIIGGGAAAFAAATKASELGVKTAMINAGLPVGGTCVNVGCVPSKHLLEVGNDYYYPARNHFQAVTHGQSTFDFKTAIAVKDEVIDALRQSNYRKVLDGLENVTFIEGHAQFIAANEVEVNGQVLRGEQFLIATGSSPQIIRIKGLDRVQYLTNREALSLPILPKTMIVIGSGPLGMEFAQMYQHFGTQVTVLERDERILMREEAEVSEELRRCLAAESIAIHTRANVERVSAEGTVKIVEARIAGERQIFKAEQLLMATGVTPNTKSLALERVGVTTNRSGAVVVNEFLQTSVRHIWAAGDVVSRMPLETVAAKEGAIAASNALEKTQKTIGYTTIPHAVFTMPQVASVGLTEAQLMERIGVCACRTVPIAQVPKAKAIGETRGLIKMVIDPETSVIVGVHMVAPLAADMIHEATLTVKHKLTVDDLIDTVHVFPTLSEGIKIAAQAFRRDISRMSCCVE